MHFVSIYGVAVNYVSVSDYVAVKAKANVDENGEEDAHVTTLKVLHNISDDDYVN